MATSDLLAHLLHEHQAGFVNRFTQAHYRLRTALADGKGKLSPEDRPMIEGQVEALTQYLLFTDEAILPAPFPGDRLLKEEFLATRRTDKDGNSLKDFDLETHLFRNRCSYMIYSPLFQHLPPGFKKLVYTRLGRALALSPADPEFSYLPPAEKVRIKAILKATLTDLPADW